MTMYFLVDILSQRVYYTESSLERLQDFQANFHIKNLKIITGELK